MAAHAQRQGVLRPRRPTRTPSWSSRRLFGQPRALSARRRSRSRIKQDETGSDHCRPGVEVQRGRGRTTRAREPDGLYHLPELCSTSEDAAPLGTGGKKGQELPRSSRTPNSANANGKGHSARGATQARKQTASNGANSWRKEGEHGARSGGTVWRGFVEEVHPPAHLHSRSPPPAETCATSTDQPAAPVARRRRPTLMPATANRVLWLRKGDLTQIT